MSENRRARSVVRGVSVLLAGVLIGLLLLTPVGAHVGGTVRHLWRDHVKPRADARYLHAVQTVESDVVTVGAGTTGEATATCPAGKKVTGGGFGTVGFDQTMLTARSAPQPSGDAWRIVVRNPGSGDGSIIAYAVCAAVG